jgi:hypothetical protein
MMGLLNLHSNRSAAMDCLVQQMPLFRRAMGSIRVGWQAELAHVESANKVRSSL